MGARSRLAELLSSAPADARAVEFEESWWNWGALRSIARRLDAVLTEAGLEDGTRVGVVLENRPEHLAVICSVLATNRCVVTLSPLQPPERLAADIARSGLSVVVASRGVLENEGVLTAVTEAGLALRLETDGRLERAGGRPRPDAETAPGVSIEMLTSGTTGPPKRVRLLDRQFDTALESSGQRPRKGALLRSGVGLVSTPLVHIGGLWSAVAGLYAGRRLVLLRRFSLEPWVRAVERYRPPAAGLVPAALRTVLDAEVPPEKLSSLRVVTCGTTYCPPELADAFFRAYGARVLMTYGATEFAGAVAAWTLPLHEKWWDTKAGSAGRPLPGVEMRVTGEDGTLVALGEVGHLEIRTAQSPDGSEAWVRTSDLARLDEDGFVWIHGRADDAIVRGGFKVQPDQVRQALERHPAVHEAAVVALPDARLGQVPVAAVELRPGHTAPSAQELTTSCREVLTPYEVPAHIVVLDALPRTPSFKVSRVELLDLVRASLAADGAA
ncbi:class I adenylate-forming enzyme family protein [Streptomyces sp. NPDC057253]|uniref:class I adenylate-forming enzyme family protein n=1 Tax=Streptomyces sp. NPDC057253 TaxID=3346069 RepID=UPI00363E9FB6